MKNLSADHPKAKLMARKRAQILAAARDAFLRLGYEGASMEAIAAEADVSIMTLYRHAERKDDLFEAVIASACDPSDEAERSRFMNLLGKPLGDLFIGLALIAQERLADPQTVSLMRVVMAETTRFPELGDIAYRGFVGHLEEMVAAALGLRPETASLGKATQRKLAAFFIDRLFGADVLRILLGLKGLTPAEQRQRAERARDEMVGAIEAELASVARPAG
jgi:TetR/AcrR family transcriptional repressor of mexJK operon